MERFWRNGLALAALSMIWAFPASAGLLGHTVTVEYLFPNIGTVYGSNSFNVVVGPGFELNGFPVGDPRTNVDISDTNILFTYNSSGTWNSTAFNGVRFYDALGLIAPITSVTINPVTNMSGLTAARITFDGDNIWINWNGLSFGRDTIVSLDVGTEGQAVIPEPGTSLLAGAGLLAFLLWRRRN